MSASPALRLLKKGDGFECSDARTPVLDFVYGQVLALRNELAEFEKSMRKVLDRVHADHHASAHN